jgi:hypothetical protein
LHLGLTAAAKPQLPALQQSLSPSLSQDLSNLALVVALLLLQRPLLLLMMRALKLVSLVSGVRNQLLYPLHN